MVTLITVPKTGATSSAPPKGATVETRQQTRRMAMKAAKELARTDPKKEGLRRQDWRRIFA